MQELMACRLAAELADGEVMVVGGVSLIPMAAGLLAQQTHAPNLTLVTGSGAVNPRPKALVPSGADEAYLSTAEALIDIQDVFDHTEKGTFDVICLGGMQVDRYGNINLTVVDAGPSRGLVRGPGLVNVGITMTVGRTMLCVTEHRTRTMVPSVDFASGAGRRRPDGTPYPARKGGGPSLCITPLAVLDFDERDQMRVASVHPGVAPEEVRERTGFPLAIHDAGEPTPTPSPEILDVLRRRVDPTGWLSR
ncbi:CoA-transferase subunit beta [Euzebya pacifica]|uniref:CoA-transferase subunit beta n=1 Tax=Euzebya pacifica TaxID=1608957 RepID=UPI0013DF8233|nr:CoA-transferase [Euzebya pacifica]